MSPPLYPSITCGLTPPPTVPWYVSMWARKPIVGTLPAAGCVAGTLPGTEANTYPHSSMAASAHPIWTLFFVWQPYAAARVAGYIVIATVLSDVFLAAVMGHRPKWSRVAKYAAIGVGLVALDLVLKAMLAPWWGQILKWTAGL